MASCIKYSWLKDLETVRHFVEDHINDINEQDKDYGKTALIIACENNNKLEIVKYLVEDCKADTNIQDRYGRTAFVLACFSGHLEIAQYLADARGVNKAFLGASIHNRLEVVKFLAEECQADVNHRDYGRTALIIACTQGHFEIVQFLVKVCKADVNLKNQHGHTAFMVACLKGHLQVMKFLLNI